VAITQISRIQQRSGLQVDLPRLSTAEFGWSTDSRRLFIGNGTPEEGAPVIGNTEILTEFSDILNLSDTYTYDGIGAGYTVQTGPTIDDPVTMTLQQWMDQWVTVRDFGAVGDGFTDNTAAINRALYEIYCRDVNPQVRRAIYFPAGVYRVTGTILVPPYATLYGDGAENSIILMTDETGVPFVMRTTDSDQQYGINLGSNAAVLPRDVTLANLCLSARNPEANLLLLECIDTVRIESVGFNGPLTTNELDSNVSNSAAIRFKSIPTLVTNSVTINNSHFSGLTYAVNSNDAVTGVPAVVKGVTINGCKLNSLYQGVVVGNTSITGIDTGPTGFRITNNVFDSIYAQGIYFGKVRLNASAYNIFYDVGNYLLGESNPYTPVIEFLHGDNLSIGDLFARSDAASGIIDPGTSYPRIVQSYAPSFAVVNGAQVNTGTHVRMSGTVAPLIDGTLLPTPVINESGVPVSVNSLEYETFSIDYVIIRGSAYRKGRITATAIGNAPSLAWSDDFVENEPSGVTLSFEQTGTVVSLVYTCSILNINAVLSYSIQAFAYPAP
jgi:hypothetical protein